MMAGYTKVLRLVQASLLASGLIFGSAALVSPAAAGSQVPFRASIFEQFHAIPCPPAFASASFCATTTPGTGAGLATHMGSVTQPQHLTVITFDPNGGLATELKFVTITAANGDQVSFKLTGKTCLCGTGAGTYQITGGTGRFSGATGSGTYQTTDTFDPATGTGTDDHVYIGTIASPGSID